MVSVRQGSSVQPRRWAELIQAITGDPSVTVFEVDPSGTILLVEGPDADPELAGRSVFEVYEDAPGVAEAARRALSGDPSVTHVRVEGRTYELRYVPLKMAGRQAAYSVLGISSDVTEKLAVEEQRRLHAEALAATAHAIVITDRRGTIEWVNPAFTRLTGYPYDYAIGKNPRDLVKSGAQRPEFYQDLWRTIADGRTWQGRLINRKADGTFYHEFQTITPVRDEHGDVTHFIAVKIDVTREVQLEGDLRASLADVEHKTQELENKVRELTALNGLFGKHLEERAHLMNQVRETVADLTAVAEEAEPLVGELGGPDAMRMSADLSAVIRRLTVDVQVAESHDRGERSRWGLAP